jgi:signal transduction histidine kinase
MGTLQEINEAITSTLELNAILEMILDRALELTGATCGTLQLVSEDGQTLELVAERGATLVSIGERLELGDGVMGKAARDDRIYRISDLQSPEWIDAYRAYIPGMRSGLTIPMRFEDRVVGVLNIESSAEDAFDGDDERLLNSLARQAAIAIQNAKQYEALREAQDELLTAGAIAWMGLFGSEWSHTVAQKTYSIRSYVDTLKDIAAGDNSLVEQALNSIDVIAQELQDVPLTMPSPADIEKGEPILIDSFVSGLLKRWCEPHEHVHPELDLCCDGVLIRADEILLKMALQKLVDNAIRHMPNGGTLRVESRMMPDGFVTMGLQDTGSGIPGEYKSLFGRRRIPKREGDSGSGMGALLARFILRKYGGDLELVWSEKGKGTRLDITLSVCK